MVLQASSRRVSDYQMFFRTCFQPNCCAVKWSSLLSNFPVQNSFLIGRSRGRCRCMPPQQDPILAFLHTFLPKSAHIRGWHPPMARHPTTGNPGSAPLPGVRMVLKVIWIPSSKLMSLNCCKSLSAFKFPCSKVTPGVRMVLKVVRIRTTNLTP